MQTSLTQCFAESIGAEIGLLDAGEPDLVQQAVDLRRAWAERDFCTAARLLQALAQSSRYSSQNLARALRITPRHLQRLFARTVGRAPQTWLREERLRAAHERLPAAGSVKEVAYALGFRSVAQFSRDFRRQFGLTPSLMLAKRRRLPQ